MNKQSRNECWALLSGTQLAALTTREPPAGGPVAGLSVHPVAPGLSVRPSMTRPVTSTGGYYGRATGLHASNSQLNLSRFGLLNH
jgi:hypothetical protein